MGTNNILKKQEVTVKNVFQNKMAFVSSHKRGLIITLFLVVLTLVAVLIVPKLKLSQFSPFSKKAVSDIPTYTPRPIPHGEKGFSVSQSDKNIPKFGRGSINPYDPIQGATQKVTINVTHTQPVTKVSATLKTDHTVSKPVAFTLIGGTDTNGQWQGSWVVNDTYLFMYQLTLTAESTGFKPASVTITLR